MKAGKPEGMEGRVACKSCPQDETGFVKPKLPAMQTIIRRSIPEAMTSENAFIVPQMRNALSDERPVMNWVKEANGHLNGLNV